jgi:hypothetical protein
MGSLPIQGNSISGKVSQQDFLLRIEEARRGERKRPG